MNHKHGKAHSRVYGVWSKMKSRCLVPSDAAYANYGGRGIVPSADWADFDRFFADMGEPPKGYTLERIDNNGGYCKENCKWASRVEQGRNKRNNVLIEIDGETMPLSAWAERMGLKYATVHRRIAQGWAPEDAVKTPLITVRAGIKAGVPLYQAAPLLVSYCGEQMTLKDASKRAGLKFSTVYGRVRRGWSVDDALSERPHHGPHSSRGAQHGVVFHDDEARAA